MTITEIMKRLFEEHFLGGERVVWPDEGK